MREFREEEYQDIVDAFQCVYFVDHEVVKEVYDKRDLLELCFVRELSRLHLRGIPREVRNAVKEVVGDLVYEYEMYVLRNDFVIIHDIKYDFAESDADVIISNIRRFLREIDKYKEVYTRVNEYLNEVGLGNEYYAKSLWIIEMLTDSKKCLGFAKEVLKKKVKEVIRYKNAMKYTSTDSLNMVYWMLNVYILYPKIEESKRFEDVKKIYNVIRDIKEMFEGE